MTSGKTTPGWPLWRRIRNEPCVFKCAPCDYSENWIWYVVMLLQSSHANTCPKASCCKQLQHQEAGIPQPRPLELGKLRKLAAKDNLPTKIIPTKKYWLKLSGKLPMHMIILPLKIKIMFESNPLTSRILVRRLAVCRSPCQVHSQGSCLACPASVECAQALLNLEKWRSFGRHYSSNATCLIRPHLFSTALLVQYG